MEYRNYTYWSSINHARVAILGIYPPPFGGVSVHIHRVIDYLSMQNNKLFFWQTEQKLRVIFPVYMIKLIWWLIKNRPKYIYYHSTYLSLSVFELLCIVSAKRFIKYQIHVVDHDCRHLYNRNSLTIKIYHWVIKRVDSVICIGESTKKSYNDRGIFLPTIVVENAFIPPIKRYALHITKSYPSSLPIFIKENTPILLVSAAHLMYTNNRDIYGIDSSLYILAGLHDEFPDTGLIIGLPEIGNKNYFIFLRQLMKKLDIAEHVYLLLNNKELWPLFEHIDIFLRPTLSDGDSISVREALYFNVPVIASDICIRPQGVHSFVTNNYNDAVFVTKKVLKESVYGTQRKRDCLYP